MEKIKSLIKQTKDCIRLGNVNGKSGGSFAGQVYDNNYVAPTLTDMQGGGRQPHIIEVEKMEDKNIKELGSVLGQHSRWGVYDDNGISPTLPAAMGMGGGYIPMVNDVKCCAMRGRNPDKPTSRESGLPTEQVLEVNENGTSNCLTSVAKDNLVLEEKQVKVKQATKQGYAECMFGNGGVESSMVHIPNSNTRRGRVQGNGEICPTLTALENGIYRIEECEEDENHYSFKYLVDGEVWQIRIRKLTPNECWRLMDFKDEDFKEAEQVNSNTQLYKQAGNSIVKNVLVGVFGQMLEGKEDVYKGVD